MNLSERTLNLPSLPHCPDLFSPLRRWCQEVTINHPQMAHRICRFIPAQCPFSRTIILFNRKIFTIPPLCKLNPLYEELVALRFRALCYLADVCEEDIQQYC